MVNNQRAPDVVRFDLRGNPMWEWLFGGGWGSTGVKG
jgi:hypothetical protein